MQFFIGSAMALFLSSLTSSVIAEIGFKSKTGASSVETEGDLIKKLPNIVLVMADDQGWGDMGYQGHPRIQTPHFDALAKEGIRFDNFYAAAPVCSPTRGSVLTGRHPNRFGCFKWGNMLRPQEITIAEALKERGYRSGHFGKWHLGSVLAGSPVSPGGSGFDVWLSAPNFFDNDPILSREGKATQLQGESSMITVDAALDFIKSHLDTSPERPFLAVVWFGSPHSPHRAVPDNEQLYADIENRNLRHFYGEITGMDRAFGKLRQSIQTLGIRDNTILWYVSDNGALPNLGATGGARGKKASIYDGGLRVPGLLEWPDKFEKPAIYSARCNTTDILPTLLDWTGQPANLDRPLDGVSLACSLESGAQHRLKPMGFWDRPEKGSGVPSHQWMTELLEAQNQGEENPFPERLRLDAGEIKINYPMDDFQGHAAWIDGDWKLHRIQPKPDQEIRWELYNLRDDPAETKDLLEAYPQRVAQMKQALKSWQTSVLSSLNGHDYTN